MSNSVGKLTCPVGESAYPVGESTDTVGECICPVGELTCPVDELTDPVNELTYPFCQSTCSVGESADAKQRGVMSKSDTGKANWEKGNGKREREGGLESRVKGCFQCGGSGESLMRLLLAAS